MIKMMNPRQFYNDRVLFEIVKQLKGKECALLGPQLAVRCMKAHNMGFLKSNLNAYSFFNKPFNIYYSMALLENMPLFSYDYQVRKKQQEKFALDFEKYVVGYDLGLDFDEYCKYDYKHYCKKLKITVSVDECKKCKKYETNFPIVYGECKRLKDEFDKYHIPYRLKFTGSGFHIEVSNEVLPSLDVSDKVNFCKRFCTQVASLFNLTVLDTSVYLDRQLWKVAYSLDNKTGNVALPLSDKQFEKFHFDMVNPKYALLNIQNRGLLQREGDKKNFENFCNDYIENEETKNDKD